VGSSPTSSPADFPDALFRQHGINIIRGEDVELVDTVAPGRPSVRFSRAEFQAFLAGVHNGEFDLNTLLSSGARPAEETDR
jgi:hypothetical protein